MRSGYRVGGEGSAVKPKRGFAAIAEYFVPLFGTKSQLIPLHSLRSAIPEAVWRAVYLNLHFSCLSFIKLVDISGWRFYCCGAQTTLFLFGTYSGVSMKRLATFLLFL